MHRVQLSFFHFSKLFVHLSPPEANRLTKDGYLSSIDDIVLAVFEKIILFFLLPITRSFDCSKTENVPRAI